jgi:hypothetical protein
MKRDEVRRLRASSQRSTRVASELLPEPLGVPARSWLIDRLTPATKSEARCRKDVANEHALPPAFAKPASVGEARLAYRCACGAPRGARRDPKRIVDTKRFALFGAPSPFI